MEVLTKKIEEIPLYDILVILLAHIPYERLRYDHKGRGYQLENGDLTTLLQINRNYRKLEPLVHKKLNFTKRVLVNFFKTFRLDDLKSLSPNSMEFDFPYLEKHVQYGEGVVMKTYAALSDPLIAKDLKSVSVKHISLISLGKFSKCKKIVLKDCRLTELDLPKQVRSLSLENVTIGTGLVGRGSFAKLEVLEAKGVTIDGNQNVIRFFLEDAPRLRSLVLTGLIFEPCRDLFKKLTSLESLCLFRGGSILPKTFRTIAKLPNLTELDVYGPLVREDSLKFLKKIKTLSLHYSSIENFPNLENLISLNIRSSELISFYPLQRLRILHLTNCPLIEEIRGMEGLQDILISVCPKISILSDLPNLRRMQIFSDRRGSVYQIKEIVKLEELETLCISSPSLISKIEDCPKLKHLKLEECPLTTLSDFPELEILTLKKSSNFIGVYNVPNLKKLTLKESSLTTLCDFPELEELDMQESTNFTDVYNVPKLRVLYVTNTNFNKRSLVFNQDPENLGLPLLDYAMAFNSPSEPVSFLIRVIGYYRGVLDQLQHGEEGSREGPEYYYEENEAGEQIFEKKIPELTVPVIKGLIEEAKLLIEKHRTE